MCSCGSDGGLPVDAGGCSIHNRQLRTPGITGRQVLLEGGQCANGSDLYIVMAQSIAHLYGEEEVFLQGKNGYAQWRAILIYRVLIIQS